MLFNRLLSILAILAQCRVCQGALNTAPPLASTAPSWVHSAVSPRLLLCAHCEQHLPFLRNPCPVCALPLATPSKFPCGECLKKAPLYDRALAPFYYQPPMNEWLPQFKFAGRTDLAPGLAAYLTAYLKAELTCGDRAFPEALAAVPLHPKRLRQRGFNQAQLLARPVARSLGMRDLSRQLKRIRYTQAQSELTRKERLRNLRGAFAVSGKLPRSLLLLDDVHTSGATFNELSRTLRQAGVEQIIVCSLARAVIAH